MPSQPFPSPSSDDEAAGISTEDALQLLCSLLSKSPDDGTGVDSVTFRARHHKKRELLDRLETERLIRRDQDRYFVSLLALAAMDHELARKILTDAEALYAELRSQYLADPRQPVKLVELANATGRALGDTRQALRYMLESPTWCSGYSNLLSSPDAQLQVSEGVLTHETFRALIEQLKKWRASSLHQRLSWTAPGLLDSPGDPASLVRLSLARGGKPPWFARLPADLREIMDEVYAAAGIGLRALPVMGIRAALDMLFFKLLGDDRGTFEQKVNALCAGNLLSATERDQVLAAIDAGNASAHRGHFPDAADLETILAVCERILHSHLVLPDATIRLRTNTPPRAAPRRHRAGDV